MAAGGRFRALARAKPTGVAASPSSGLGGNVKGTCSGAHATPNFSSIARASSACHFPTAVSISVSSKQSFQTAKKGQNLRHVTTESTETTEKSEGPDF